jgi:glycerol-3-phosphate acyltransferase PlsY
MMIAKTAVSLLIIFASYLIGSIPIAYLAGRILKGIDIRRYGSANVGASNVYQSVARWAVVPVGVAQIAPRRICMVLSWGNISILGLHPASIISPKSIFLHSSGIGVLKDLSPPSSPSSSS